MSTASIPATATIQFMDLKKEAAIEPDPVSTGPVTKETQIIAIYGKGGIGKSQRVIPLHSCSAEKLAQPSLKLHRRRS